MTNFLEVDPSLIENKILYDCLRDDGSVGKFFRTSDDNVQWTLATPEPGCCIKTIDKFQNKIFLNICQLEDIPEPKDISEAELLDIWQCDEASDYRVPLSLQDPHDEFDKSGKPTKVYDVAINPKLFRKIQQNDLFRTFVFQIIFEGIENKFSISFQKEGYIILKNRKCIGRLNPHRIRVNRGNYMPPKRLVEELPGEERPFTSDHPPRKPKFRFYENTRKLLLVGEFYLPEAVAIDDISLHAGQDRLLFRCRKYNYLLDLFMPLKTNSNKVTALFLTESKVLFVSMPILA